MYIENNNLDHDHFLVMLGTQIASHDIYYLFYTVHYKDFIKALFH